MEYKIRLSFDAGKAVDGIGELMDAFNSHLAKMGMDDKLLLRSKALSCDLCCNRELIKEEKDLIAETIVRHLDEAFPGWGFKVESFRRQPCNKSRSQAHR